jgi:MtN3 and saliva related transmembrane protein
MQPYELIGFLAGALIAIALIPQVIKSWKTKSTKDISIFWNSLYVAGLVLWIVYGSIIMSVPMIVSACVEISLAISLLVLKLKYG